MFARMLVIVLTVACAGAWAVDGNVLSLKPEIQRGSIYKPEGFWPLLGAGLGVTDHNSSIRTGGVPTHVKLLGSYYFATAPWVADGAIGLHNEFLTQDGAGSDTIQSLHTELAARYQFTNRWQLGAIWNTLVDNPDRYRSNTNNLASFMGVQVLKEFTWDNQYLVRAGGRALTDVGISGETVDTVMAEVQVSFGPAKNQVVEVEPVKVESRPLAPHLARQAVQSYDLNTDNVLFETDSTQLIGSSRQYLRRLARALADNRHLFDHMQVVGHADQRGPDDYNDHLSKRRAVAVASTLIAAGLNRSQVITDGRGKLEPLVKSMTPQALQKNRRVELQFSGVKNDLALKNVLDSVK